MSPSELMIRTIHWVCPCCGEVARGNRPPHDCLICGRNGSAFEPHREVFAGSSSIALPSD